MPNFSVGEGGFVKDIGIIFNDANKDSSYDFWGNDIPAYLHVTFGYARIGSSFFEKVRGIFATALGKRVDGEYETTQKFGQRDSCSSLSFTNPVEIFYASTALRDLFLSDNENFRIGVPDFVKFEAERLTAWKNAAAHVRKRLAEIPVELKENSVGRYYLLDEKDEAKGLRSNGGDVHSINEQDNAIRNIFIDMKNCQKEKLEAERKLCEDFIARYANPVDFCEDNLNSYVVMAEKRSSLVAMRCIKNLINEKTLPLEAVKEACKKPLRIKTSVTIRQALFDLDPFQFLELPKIEKQKQPCIDSFEEKPEEKESESHARISFGTEMIVGLLPLRKKETLSNWDIFRNWIAKKCSRTSKLFKIATFFASDETVACEGNHEAQYKLAMQLKVTNKSKAEYWLTHATLSANPNIKAAACYELASMYIADYNNSEDYDTLCLAAEWCRRAALIDAGQGLKKFLDTLFKTYKDDVHSLRNNLFSVVGFLTEKSRIIRAGILQHKLSELINKHYTSIYGLVLCTIRDSNDEKWDDKTACQAVEALAILPTNILKENFRDGFNNYFYETPKACALILTKPSLMTYYEDPDHPQRIGSLLNNARHVISNMVRNSPNEIPHELLAYIKYAETTDLTEYNNHYTGLRMLSHDDIIQQIALHADYSQAYQKLLNTVYLKKGSCFTRGIEKPVVANEDRRAMILSASLGGMLSSGLSRDLSFSPSEASSNGSSIPSGLITGITRPIK